MARSDHPLLVANALKLAGTILFAGLLLVAPIVLWAIYGNGDPRHAIAVALVATLLCWAFVHRVDLGQGPPPPAAPSPLHAPVDVALAPLDAAPAAPCHVARRPSAVAPRRLVRDVGCRAAEFERRRRSRP